MKNKERQTLDRSMEKRQNEQIFFQKQGMFSKKCGVCALNNLLGSKNFNNDDLNEICKRLSDAFINPYKSIFGGDYDVSVLIYALNFLNYDTKWLKNTQNIEEEVQKKNFVGFIVNKITDKKNIFMKILDFSGRHWSTVRIIDEKYIFLDSSQQNYQIYQTKQQICSFIEKLRSQGVIVLSILKQQEQVDQIKCLSKIKKTKNMIESNFSESTCIQNQ